MSTGRVDKLVNLVSLNSCYFHQAASLFNATHLKPQYSGSCLFPLFEKPSKGVRLRRKMSQLEGNNAKWTLQTMLEKLVTHKSMHWKKRHIFFRQGCCTVGWRLPESRSSFHFSCRDVSRLKHSSMLTQTVSQLRVKKNNW